MRHSPEPWKWPLATALALSLSLLVVFVTPRSWLAFGRGPSAAQGRQRNEPSCRWLTLLPPPDIRVDFLTETPKDHPSTVPALAAMEDPRWWSAGWRVRIESAAAAAQERAAWSDTLAWLWRELDSTPDPQAPPDSLLALRLALLRIHDADRFEGLKPYFLAVARAEQYRDLMSRVNAMYDEFLHREIMVPD